MVATSTKNNNVHTSKNNKANGEDVFDVIIREAGYRRCLILDGNVRDIFCNGNGGYLSLTQVLMSRLAAMDYDGDPYFTICGCWDRVDGLRFVNPIMLQAFQRVLGHRSHAGTCSGQTANQPQQYDDGSDNRQFQPSVNSFNPDQSNGMYAQPEEAFAAMRQVLSNPAERAVFILDWTEHLVGNAAHQDTNERQFLTVLSKAVAEQPANQGCPDTLKRSRGILIIITPNLASLPATLYQNNTRTKVITIPRPNRARRLDYLTRNQRDLHVAEPKPAPGQPTYKYSSGEAVINKMTDLCDGLTTVDMQNLLALSRQLPEKLRPDKLINLYKFNQQHSPWEDLDRQRLNNVTEELKKRVLGQDQAIEAVSTMLKRAYMGLGGLHHSSDRKKPRGILFFVGPTGVGKTELAKATAEFLFGDENACIRFDMSEYSQEHDAWVRKHEYYLISKAERFSNLLTFQPEAVRQMKTIYPEFYAEIMASEAAADATKAETEKVERFKEKQHKFTDRLSQLDPEDRKLLDESMDTIHRLLSKLK